MSAKIRLSRVGGKKKPFYRVVVIDESEKRDGMPIEVIGHYDPRKEPSVFEINTEKAQEWLKKGALPSDVVRKFLGKAGILPAVNFDKKKKKPPKNKGEEAPADAASQPAAAPAEKPKEEPKAEEEPKADPPLAEKEEPKAEVKEGA